MLLRGETSQPAVPAQLRFPEDFPQRHEVSRLLPGWKPHTSLIPRTGSRQKPPGSAQASGPRRSHRAAALGLPRAAPSRRHGRAGRAGGRCALLLVKKMQQNAPWSERAALCATLETGSLRDPLFQSQSYVLAAIFLNLEQL